jgi:hypothetical protein
MTLYYQFQGRSISLHWRQQTSPLLSLFPDVAPILYSEIMLLKLSPKKTIFGIYKEAILLRIEILFPLNTNSLVPK